ncbi:Biotin-protein ligase [Imhoffiella purpurea]|uniref:Bifunctional ligase/repressor BirA n=1 Tax=Imhoffiella purpurea TaxID=1249627 RepID=W9VEW4_9GAMM|nr:Biotin-protein ligase [Imhoffiella purpurea]
MEPHLALVRMLADGRFHSGEAIAEHLGVTRAAVWKALRRAADRFGLEVESVRGRGYRLPVPLELLDREAILGAMSDAGRNAVSRVEIHDRIDSTNAYLMREAALGMPSGVACLAERQTAGRGRRGRVWVSPFGVNLYLSLLWRFPLAPAALGGISLAVGAVLADLLHAEGVADLTLKWPNDLLWRRRKLAGLLLEVSGESQGPSHLVVGLGINLRMQTGQGDEIEQPWASLEEALQGRPCPRNRLAGKVLDVLAGALDLYGREGLEPFAELWRRFDGLHGEPVRLMLGERVVCGTHAGIADDGSLILETGGGRMRFQAGEVSLRAMGS